VQQAAQGTQQVAANIGEVKDAASTTGGAAEEMLETATRLAQSTTQLHGSVDAFLGDIRAA